MALNVHKSMPDAFHETRNELIAKEIIVKRETYYEFVQDKLFDTPSEAAGVIGGARLTGTKMWKSEDGRNLNELMGKKK